MNTALALSINSAMEKRRTGPYSKPSHLRLIRPDDDDDTVVVLQKAWIVDPEPVREPVAVASAPEYEPGLFVRIGDAVLGFLSSMLDAVLRQLGFLLIVSAIVGMTSVGHWVGFNQRVALDAIAKVSAIMDDMADGLPPKIIVHDWNRETGERVDG